MLSNMSFKKSLLCVGGLLLAVGGPIGMFSANDFVANARKNWFSGWTAKASANPQAPSTTLGGAGEGYTAKSNSLSPAHAASLPGLDEVLSFDRSVEWVMQRWPRVSTGLTYLQLQGYRVPLVTGTGLSDVAGSLTYYFNAGQQVQRITLRGIDRRPDPLSDPSDRPLSFRPPADQRSGLGALRSRQLGQQALRHAQDSLGQGGESQSTVYAVRG